ncbi:MAG TPA: ferredoxin reductase [Acidimicrobiia bacterium]|nr:ferredoxin reductase [Acidimicrobiia bacterium]
MEIIEETPRVKSLVFSVPGWTGHLPGQHVDIRLTAEDGYQAQRSYSLATPSRGDSVTLTVELVEDGEVSPYLVEELRVGDRIELRGPIGGYFVWSPNDGGPLQLIGGGSGVVPLMAMIRAQAHEGPAVPTRLLFSARTHLDLIYREELDQLVDQLPKLEVYYSLTRSQPEDWHGYRRRVDRAMLAECGFPATLGPHVFTCGPTGFVESVASHLLDLGHSPHHIKTERFGPTGG